MHLGRIAVYLGILGWGILGIWGRMKGSTGAFLGILRHMWPIAVYLGILGHIGHIGAYEGEYWSILRHMGA
jgi:hypothetical protein